MAASLVIVSNICGRVIAFFRVRAKGNDMTGKISGKIIYLLNVATDDDVTIFRDQSGEFFKTVPDIINIFKEIKMIFFDI